MHDHSIASWRHRHDFLGAQHQQRERRTWIVVGLTAVMMLLEIGGGAVFGSMALVADGWHMSTHAAALAIAGFAYSFARSHSNDPHFAFGTGKFGALAGYTSAVILGIVALLVAFESVVRLSHPVAIDYGEAIAIATLGLAVNVVSAWLLRDEHDHHHHHHDQDHEDDDHGHAHDDHNWRAAYVHVLADAVVSVLAIAGLLVARYFGWVAVDPLVGIVGAGVIASWAFGLIRSSGAMLLDTVPTSALAETIRGRLERDGDLLSDLHLWRVGPGHHAVIAAIVSDSPRTPSDYKKRLADIPGLSHVTIEVEPCTGEHAPLRPAA